MKETLGPGMPSGVGEDIYLFYKILKAGYSIVYEPKANLWHKHRRSMKALRRQLYNYNKGIVSYHLTTLLRDGDLRTLYNAAVHLPIWHLRRIINRLRHRSDCEDRVHWKPHGPLVGDPLSVRDHRHDRRDLPALNGGSQKRIQLRRVRLPRLLCATD